MIYPDQISFGKLLGLASYIMHSNGKTQCIFDRNFNRYKRYIVLAIGFY